MAKASATSSWWRVSPLQAPGQSAWINLLKGPPTLILLDELPPYFDNAFLKELSGRFTRPAMPEREHLDYLVKQVVAEYLASEYRLDGLLYPSVQVAKDLPATSRTNIVLFHHAILESIECLSA